MVVDCKRLDKLMKSGRLGDGLDLFDRMPRRTSGISGCTRNGRPEAALPTPNDFACNAALAACADAGEQVHSLAARAGLAGDAMEYTISALHCAAVKRGLTTGIRVSNALLSMYGRCGAVEELEAVLGEPRSRQLDGCRFSQLPERVQREGGGAAVSDALGFAPNEYAFSSGLRRPGVAGPREAAPLPGATSSGVVRAGNALVNKCGEMGSASWNSLIHGGGARGDAVPDESTFLEGCSHEEGEAVFGLMAAADHRYACVVGGMPHGPDALVWKTLEPGRGEVRTDVEYPRDARGGCGGGWVRKGLYSRRRVSSPRGGGQIPSGFHR